MQGDEFVRGIANVFDVRIGPSSQLEEMIEQACDSAYSQPNLSLNLEICDLINKRLKTFPRDAAFAIVRHVNRGSQSTAHLALALLDHCVKNCGYPFHLVIASKEFLNELVRRFPETPTRLNSVHHRILELIHLWNSTLCVSSRYKEDFKHINDMYRLLVYKGYRFPDVVVTDSLDVSGLKTEEELAEEDRKAQGVKLEELLRIGTPAALAQANDLMKIMSGFDTSRQRDYKKEVNDELDRIESKALLLNDLLNQRTPGWERDATIEEIYGAVKTSQSRVQKFLDEDTDEERVSKLLELNDLINTVVQKYNDLKNNKPVSTTHIDRPRAQAPSAGPINLIDFDQVPSYTAPTQTAQPSTLNDLLGLENVVKPTHQTIVQNTFQPIDLLSDPPMLAKPSPTSTNSSPTSGKAVLYDKYGLQVQLFTKTLGTSIEAQAVFFNTSLNTYTNIGFMVAVPKSMELSLEPLTSNIVQPQSKVMQALVVKNPLGEPFRLRYKLSFNLNGTQFNESGEYS